MSDSVRLVRDADAVGGKAWLFPYAFGGFAPLKFSGITYGDKTPTVESGLVFQLLIKTSRAEDATTIIDVTNVNLTFLESPLIVGYLLDTTTTGFERATDFPGELWLVDSDAAYKRQLVSEFIVALSNPTKRTFV